MVHLASLSQTGTKSLYVWECSPDRAEGPLHVHKTRPDRTEGPLYVRECLPDRADRPLYVHESRPDRAERPLHVQESKPDRAEGSSVRPENKADRAEGRPDRAEEMPIEPPKLVPNIFILNGQKKVGAQYTYSLKPPTLYVYWVPTFSVGENGAQSSLDFPGLFLHLQNAKTL